MAHVRQRDLRRVQVLEGNVHRLERHFELIHLRGEKAAELGKFRTQNGDSPRLATRVSKKEGRPERCVLQSSAPEIVASHSFDFEARRAPLGCVSPHRGGAFRPSNHCHIKQLILSDPLLDPKDVGPKQTVAQANPTAPTCFRQNSRYLNTGSRSSSLQPLKPFFSSAAFIGLLLIPPVAVAVVDTQAEAE